MVVGRGVVTVVVGVVLVMVVVISFPTSFPP